MSGPRFVSHWAHIDSMKNLGFRVTVQEQINSTKHCRLRLAVACYGNHHEKTLVVADFCYARLVAVLAVGCISAAYARVGFETFFLLFLGAEEQHGGRFTY